MISPSVRVSCVHGLSITHLSAQPLGSGPSSILPRALRHSGGDLTWYLREARMSVFDVDDATMAVE